MYSVYSYKTINCTQLCPHEMNSGPVPIVRRLTTGFARIPFCSDLPQSVWRNRSVGETALARGQRA